MAVVLLVAGVAGALGRPFRLPAWLAPLACAGAAVLAGVVTLAQARRALGDMAAPLAFLLAAVPLAVMLDELGFFATVAERVTARGYGAGALWVLAAVVTTVLNLDASVVLLTPLYVRIARRSGLDPLALAVQPVLLACLASSALPISNLTNLIATQHTGARPADFLANLALPSLVATTVGWWCYRRVVQRDRAPVGRWFPGGVSEPAVLEAAPGGRPDALAVGGTVLAALVVGFVLGPAVGVPPWAVALAGDAVLVAVLRRPPWRHLPVGTALVAGSLAVLAAGAVADLPLHRLVGGDHPLSLAGTVAATAVGANLINNLPMLLVTLPALGSHPTPALWATLVGVNMGPVVLVTGSLASLLWLDALGRLGVPVRPRDFSRYGVAVGLPAAVAGAASFLILNAVH